MALFTLAGEPQLYGSRLYWSGVLDPGHMQAVAAQAATDTVDCWRMTANDPAGTSTNSELIVQIECKLPHDVMPGDSYQNSCDLDLRDGYYHVVLSIDSDNGGAVYLLHVRVENGGYDLQSWHLHMA
jgi:hypothetical protein